MMKRTLFLGVSILALCVTAAPAFADKIVVAQAQPNKSNVVGITPFNLVKHGYQGFFLDRGIPSNGSFIRAVHNGKVTANDLVEAGIAEGRLAPETINDRAYLREVSINLRNLNGD